MAQFFCLNDPGFSFPCRCTRVHCTEVFGWGEGIFAVLFNSKLLGLILSFLFLISSLRNVCEFRGESLDFGIC